MEKNGNTNVFSCKTLFCVICMGLTIRVLRRRFCGWRVSRFTAGVFLRWSVFTPGGNRIKAPLLFYMPTKLKPKSRTMRKDLENAMEEVLIKENFDPLTFLIRKVKETMPVYDKDGNKVLDAEGNEQRVPLLVHQMGPKDGWREIMGTVKDLLNYQRPKLRASENKTTSDMNFHITIESYQKEHDLLELEKDKVIEMATADGEDD